MKIVFLIAFTASAGAFTLFKNDQELEDQLLTRAVRATDSSSEEEKSKVEHEGRKVEGKIVGDEKNKNVTTTDSSQISTEGSGEESSSVSARFIRETDGSGEESSTSARLVRDIEGSGEDSTAISMRIPRETISEGSGEGETSEKSD